MLPYIGTGLPEVASGKALRRSSSFLKYLSAAYHSSYPAANAACNSSETLQLFSPGSKSEDGKPKMTALNSLPHSFPRNKFSSPPLLNYVTDYKAFRGQKVGNLTYVPWRYVLGVHTGKEAYSDYFLNPGTILCIQLGAVATGSSPLVLWFASDFSQGLRERITQIEVILIFLWYLFW